LWTASPASAISCGLTALRTGVDCPPAATPGSSLFLLLPVSGRAGARASTWNAWRSRAFGGGALRRRPTGRI
jgi:hypothetical protein